METSLIEAIAEDYPEDALSVGTVLEGYRILSLLGRGAFGITYLASEEKLDRLVAIKEYLPEDFAVRDEASTVRAKTGSHGEMFEYGRSSFLKEAKTLVKFKHDNIVRVLTFFEHYDTAYLVMEYEKGVDLRGYLKKKPHLTQAEMLSIFLPINQGLSIVHEYGFIHRDIKPGNIYIRDDGSPVLLDFGAARDVVKSKVNELTRILTEGYAPYEQDNPAWSDQGPWTDIYALGATLYMTVMGHKPVSASNRAAAFMMKKEDPYVSVVTTSKKGYSPPFLSAIDKALDFHPENRPQSLKQWNSMLSLVDEDETVLMPATQGAVSLENSKTRIHRASTDSSSFTTSNADFKLEKNRFLSIKHIFLITSAVLFFIIAGYFLLVSKTHDVEPVTKLSPVDNDVNSRSNNQLLVDEDTRPNVALEPVSSNQPGTTVALEGVVTQAMLFARTATVQYASGQANKKHLEEYKKAFSSDSNRTGFVVALQKKISQSENNFEKNFSQYSIVLIKLSRYTAEDVQAEVNSFLNQPDYVSETAYKNLGEVIVKHARDGIGMSANWKEDLIELARN